ncbi:MAG: hypothetical protein AB1439_01440 [candidate division FCPU426 bacterium]
MKKVWLLAGVMVSALVLGGMARAEQMQGSTMQEDPGRMEQPGAGYEQEGVMGASAGPEQAMQGYEEEDAAGAVTAASAQPGSKSSAPGRGYIWVKPYRLPSGLWVSGFWRPRVMAGFTWVNGTWDAKLNIYLGGFWRPMRPKPGYVWVPGYWLGGRWYSGLWRAASRKGFIWTPGHWNRNGEWISPHWKPAGSAPSGQVWVPGYWSPQGAWVAGFWRPTARPGAVWVAGYHSRRGVWVPGHWRSAPPAPPRFERGRGRGHRR